MWTPDLDSLRCYLALSQSLNFRRAAQAVSLSPAAFSERIKRLEQELGGALFERTTRVVALTPLGARLLPAARRMINEAERFHEAVESHGSSLPYTVRLGTRYELGLSWLTPALSSLEALKPERSVALTMGEDAMLLERLRERALDAVVSSVRVNVEGLRAVALHEERYAFVASPTLLERVGEVTPSRASCLRLIDTDASLPLFRYYLDSASEEFWSFSEQELLGTIGAVRYRVLEGAGVAVLPRYFIAPHLAEGSLIAIRQKKRLLQDYFRLLWLESHPLRAQLELLATHLKAIPLR